MGAAKQGRRGGTGAWRALAGGSQKEADALTPPRHTAAVKENMQHFITPSPAAAAAAAAAKFPRPLAYPLTRGEKQLLQLQTEAPQTLLPTRCRAALQRQGRKQASAARGGGGAAAAAGGGERIARAATKRGQAGAVQAD